LPSTGSFCLDQKPASFALLSLSRFYLEYISGSRTGVLSSPLLYLACYPYPAEPPKALSRTNAKFCIIITTIKSSNSPRNEHYYQTVMAASGSPGLQPGSHRNSLNSEHFPPSNGLYNQPSYNSLPPNYDPHFVEDIKTELPHVLPSQQGDLNSPQQFSDYTPYPASESFGLTTSAGVNPANTLLLSSANSSHHGTSQLQIDPNQNFQGHQQPGTENYLSASSAHPSATSNVVWDQVFQAQPSWDQPRAPSECSGVSSGMSPYLGGEEYSEQPSPMVGAQHYPNPGGSMQELLGGDAFGMERFSLSDRGSPCPSTGYHSEANSPYISPQPDNHSLSPVPPMGLGVGGTGMNHIMGPPPAGHGAGPPTGLGIGDETAPRIDISYAPPQRQPTFPDKPGALPDDGALSPPPKSMCILIMS